MAFSLYLIARCHRANRKPAAADISTNPQNTNEKLLLAVFGNRLRRGALLPDADTLAISTGVAFVAVADAAGVEAADAAAVLCAASGEF